MKERERRKEKERLERERKCGNMGRGEKNEEEQGGGRGHPGQEKGNELVCLIPQDRAGCQEHSCISSLPSSLSLSLFLSILSQLPAVV